ncbi:hypothetical protein [Burkholderia sp. LMG 21824]|uniref:hypothetical protein n=1 Tax=Burkholderia sp. LMG 21824 TaxID=3158172 RepID=UPI003C303B7F
MSYFDAELPKRRALILCVLAMSEPYGSNKALLHAFMSEDGMANSTFLVDEDIAWLQSRRLVCLMDDFVLLTLRGSEVANGREMFPGVSHVTDWDQYAAAL